MMGIDSGKIMRQALQSGIPQLLAGLASSLFILLATWTFLRSIQKRLDQAVAFTKQVREGNLDIAFPDPGENEIGQLIVSFNSLMGQLQAEARERIKHEKAEKRALRLALQYQVNPHFLFNTLNWIQMTAELGVERELLSQAITLLGKLLRYNLNEQAHSHARGGARQHPQLRAAHEHAQARHRFPGIQDGQPAGRHAVDPLSLSADLRKRHSARYRWGQAAAHRRQRLHRGRVGAL